MKTKITLKHLRILTKNLPKWTETDIFKDTETKQVTFKDHLLHFSRIYNNKHSNMINILEDYL